MFCTYRFIIANDSYDVNLHFFFLSFQPKYNKEKNAVECECNNPVSTIFSNSFYVPPNVIDFSTVFNKFDLVNNGAVFGVVIAFISIYLILLVITRHYDRKDFIRVGCGVFIYLMITNKFECLSH